MLHIREWVSFFFGFRAAEGKKALAEVIQTGEEHHADEHGHIIARTHRSVGKQTQTQRFCDAVGDQVTDGDVRTTCPAPRSRLWNVKCLLRKKLRMLVST